MQQMKPQRWFEGLLDRALDEIDTASLNANATGCTSRMDRSLKQAFARLCILRWQVTTGASAMRIAVAWTTRSVPAWCATMMLPTIGVDGNGDRPFAASGALMLMMPAASQCCVHHK